MSVIGAINTREADVTVNGSDAVVLDDMTFVATNLAVSAGTNTFTAVITDPFNRKATNTSEVIVKNHGYQYDSEGNLTNDSKFAYTWNNENRLVEVKEEKSGSSVMKCRYDGQGRRRERITYSDGVATTNRYVYHGWAVLAVLDGQNNTLETYTHGIDLSGSMGGAGGIGGILSMSVVSGLQSTVYYYHYDAQGNVINVTDEDKATASTYTYSPFGQVLTKTGTFDSRYQFSTKEYDTPGHLNYYGYRYYSPQLGRWPSRDPMGARGENNLYSSVGNDAIGQIDILGLFSRSECYAKAVETENNAPPIDGYDREDCIFTIENFHYSATEGPREWYFCTSHRRPWNGSEVDGIRYCVFEVKVVIGYVAGTIEHECSWDLDLLCFGDDWECDIDDWDSDTYSYENPVTENVGPHQNRSDHKLWLPCSTSSEEAMRIAGCPGWF